MGGRFKARRRDTRPANSVTFCLHDDEEYLNESLENIRLFSETVLLFDLFSPLAVTIGRGSMDQLITERPETIDEEDLQNRHGVPIVAGIVVARDQLADFSVGRPSCVCRGVRDSVVMVATDGLAAIPSTWRLIVRTTVRFSSKLRLASSTDCRSLLEPRTMERSFSSVSMAPSASAGSDRFLQIATTTARRALS